eukprot:747429-Hanusia_phi.AAC.4
MAGPGGMRTESCRVTLRPRRRDAAAAASGAAVSVVRCGRMAAEFTELTCCDSGAGPVTVIPSRHCDGPGKCPLQPLRNAGHQAEAEECRAAAGRGSSLAWHGTAVTGLRCEGGGR